MADTKISALSTGTAAQSTDKLPIERGSANFYLTPAMIAGGGFAGSFSTIAATGNITWPNSQYIGYTAYSIRLRAGTVEMLINLEGAPTTLVPTTGSAGDGFAVYGPIRTYWGQSFQFSTNWYTTGDTHIARNAAGVVQIGTAANNASGSLLLTNLTATGKIASTTITLATLGAGVTTFAITNNVAKVTGDAGGNTIGTITGGTSGMTLTLIFVDALVTITDTAAATANTVNLSAAFTSAANTTLTLVYDGNKWFETARSVNG